MTISCLIRCLGAKPFRSFAIDESYFAEVADGKMNLQKIVAIENNFRVLMENYIEFEKAIACFAVEGMVRERYAISEGPETHNDSNRLLLNALSTIRFYFDCSDKYLLTFENVVPGLRDNFRIARNQQYDSRFGYRVMEALRNYSQHNGLPVHELYLRSDAVTREEPRIWRYRAVPILNMSKICQDNNFKAAIRNELKRLGMSFPIMPLMREYIAGICEIQKWARISLAPLAAKYSEVIASAIASSSDKIGDKCEALLLIKKDDEIDEYERVDISNRLSQRHQELLKQNHVFPGLEFRFASTESLASDK